MRSHGVTVLGMSHAGAVHLGAAIRRIRIGTGMSSSELAAAVGLSSMRMIECGHRNPSYAAMRRIAVALGVTVADLCAEADR